MQWQEGGLWGRGQPPKQVGGCWGYKERPEPSRETFISQDHVFKSRRLLHHARNKMRPPYLSTRYRQPPRPQQHNRTEPSMYSRECQLYITGLFYIGLSWSKFHLQTGKNVYSHVPIKRVGPTKRVGWIFIKFFCLSLCLFLSSCFFGAK